MMKNLFTNLMNWMMGSEMSKVVHEPAGSTTIAESPRNNPLITPLSPPNHPLSCRFRSIKTPLRFVRYAATLVLLLCLGVSQMWGAAYTPSADEVIILNNVYNSSKTDAGYSNHSAIAWGGTGSTNSMKAGDPSNNGAATSGNVTCYSVKGNGSGKNITVSITGCSKIIVYHQSHSSRYVRLHENDKNGTVIGSGAANTYYTEVNLTPATTYTIFLEGWTGSAQTDFYVYAVKLIKASSCAAADLAAANITSNGDQIVGTGITFSKVGSPASGDTWYWQTSSTGTDKTHNASSADYTTATTAGSYTVYLRAYNTAADCWGKAIGKTNTIISCPLDVYNGENVDKGNATASGWTINSSTNMAKTSGSSNGYSYWYLAGSSSSYVQFDGSIALVNGDQIKIQWTHTNGSDKTLALTINGSGASLTSGSTAKNSVLTEAVYDVTSTTNVTSIKLNSSGSSGCIIYQVSIVKAACASSCTAPSSVTVDGTWDRFVGETISLTATPYDGSGNEITTGITGYQWQKEVTTNNWEDISGATSATYSIATAATGNSGQYRCIISTGASCSTTSNAFKVRVYNLELYTGGTTYHNFTRDGVNEAGTLTLSLNANTAYTFKIHDGIEYYGNNGAINEDVTNWVFSTSQGNCTINSGLGGTFTIRMEYGTSGNSNVANEPEISVTYPRKTIYLVPNSDWLSSSAKFAYNYFRDGGSGGWTDFLTADDCGRHADIPQWNGVKVIAVRFNSSKTSTGNWDDKWNQTSDITVTSNDLITITGWDNSQTYTTYSIPTYTISYAGNGNTSGSMSNVSSIPCGEDRTLVTNAFVKTDNIFEGWKANVDVTIGGANVTAGTLISDGATLQNIHSDITLTAQWTACSGPSITAEAGMAGQTYTVGDVANTMTITASAGNGGTLHYHWYQYNVGQNPLTQSVDAVGGTDANTYTPSTASAHEGQIFYCVVSEEGCSTTVTSAYSGAITVNGVATPIITYNLNVGTSAGTTIKSSTSTTDGTNITNIDIDQTNDGANGAGASNRTTKLALATGTSAASVENPDKYELFTFKVVCGKKLTPSEVKIKVANVGSSAGGYQNYKAVLSDNYGHSISNTFTGTKSDGSVEEFSITNGGGTYFQGDVTLKIWSCKGSGGNASAFRMGTPVTIFGEVATQATPAATIIWDTHPADGAVGDDDVTIAAHASDGSTVSYSSNNVAVATIVAGKVHYVAPGTTTIQASITDMCGNTVNQNSNSFTVSAADCKVSLSKVVLSSTSAGTVTGYNDKEFAGDAVIGGLESTQTAEVDASHDGDETGYKLSGKGSAIVFATLKGTSFHAGDVVKVTITKKNDTREIDSNKEIMTIYYGTNASDAAALVTLTGVSGAGTYSYTLTAANVTTIGSKKGIGVFRESSNGQNHFVYSVEILGCREHATVYAFSNGSFTDWGTCNGGTLTLSGSQSGVSYQLYKDGVASGDAKAGTGSALNWTVTASGTYTVKSVANASYVETAMTGTAVVTLQDPALSGESTVEVGSTITLTHPGYSIGGDNWTSSNTSVATVNGSGVVAGVAAGTATITFHGVGACDGSKLITVTAPVTYTVTYNGNSAGGGTVPVDGTSYSSGATVTVLGNTGSLTRTIEESAATFYGWNTNSTGFGGTHYEAGNTFSISDNTTLYAEWGYPITYNTDGGTINDLSYPTHYIYTGSSACATAALPSDVTKAGYTFEGWYTENGAGSKVTCIEGTYTGAFAGDYALKALWEEESDCEDLFATEATDKSTLTISVGSQTTNLASNGGDEFSASGYSCSVKPNSSNALVASPKAGSTFAAGDSLIVVVYNNNSGEKTMGFTLGSGTYRTSIAAKTLHIFHQVLVAADINGSGKVTFNRQSSDDRWVAVTIKTCGLLPSCTTPTLPSLSDQTVCPGSDIAAWDATPINASDISAAGESVSYSWKKKGNDTELATTASFDLGSAATEGQAGTYVVKVTVSKAGNASVSASAEVDLAVTPATETPSVSASKAKVYQGDEVTLTASCGSTGVTWQWYTCSNAEGASESSISGATSAAYTIASAGVPGTYYYKVKATGDGTNSCGVAEYVYTLTVSAPSECETYVWWEEGAPTGEVQASCFTFGTTPTGTNGQSASMTIDGTTYNSTKRSSDWNSTIQFIVPVDAIATFYICGKGTGARTITLTDAESHTSTFSMTTTFGTFHSDEIGAGTWTMTTNGNLHIGMVALHVCVSSTCTDAVPTATAANTTVCSGTELSITASDYEESPVSIQWQKLNGSTYDNISGATSATYTVASAAAEHAGSYRVVVTKGCARTSNTVTIAVPSAPDFGSTVPASVSIMQTLALSITDVEATDAVKYRWYKSADDTWDAGDVEIGTDQTLIKAYADEAIGSPSYYVFCRAQNACGITTSSAIAVNVTAYVEEECAIRGNEGSADFGFENTGMSSGTYDSKNVWYKNSNSNYLTYTAPEGKYLATAKVTVASSNSSNASYQYSTDNGANWSSGVTISGLTTSLAEKTINLPANVTDFRIGRNLDGAGESSGTFYLHKACFTYNNACTSTTVTPSTSSVNYEIGGAWSYPTFSLSPAAVSGGTLTYSSSNEDIASVDDEGAVTFNGDAGTVTITASYAGGTVAAVDYCASEGSYTINVSCPGGAPKVVVDGSVNMSGCNSYVTLHAKQQDGTAFADGTYQWFRNGTEIDGATSSSYTATQAGTYTVERTNAGGCTTPSTNSVVITSETTEPEVERLVPFQYYHVDKTYTAQMKMRHLFAVKNSGKLDGKSFKLYVSRNGGAATDVTNSNALAIWTNADGHVDTVMIDLNKLSGKYSENDELVFTCKAINCDNNVSEVYKNTITMHVIGATPTLALICSGAKKDGSGTRTTKDMTVGGDFLTGYNPADLCQQTGGTSFDASTEWGLYTELKAEYIVTPVNGYAVFNKLNYEPFDILFLTDYPKASKSDAAATILDDMADLCDYRPLFTFKTHMVHKSPSKWAAKGFTTAPVADSKNAGKLNLNIVCYAHPMFDGIKAGTDVYEDADNVSAPLVYKMLSDVGYENSKGMQGFEIAAAENFVTIGLTHHNATIAIDGSVATWTPNSGDRMLVTAAERQANLEARMILFSLNAGAHSKLTDKGELVVLKCLEYLLDDNPLHVADCSFTFDNGASNEHDAAWYAANCNTCTGTKGDGLWSTAANWSPDYRLLPGEFTSVRIKAPVEVNIEHAHVMEARLVEDGSITIPAGKALEVKGTIRRMDGSEISPTENVDIFIGSSAAGNGSLIFNNDKGDSKATVAMYTTALADVAHMSAATSTWQYIGTPHNDVEVAKYNYYDSWLYQYDTGTEDWIVIPNGGPLVPFRGYCVTHPEANHTFVMDGKLTATTNADIAIPAGKYVVVANSWVAPIDINTIMDDDMEGMTDKTIYFFNTGTDTDGTGGTGTAAGTYRATPIYAASYTGDWQIPSMQGFYVVGGSSDGTLHLDYSRHVRPSTDRSIVGNPMYAPRRSAENNEPEVAKLYFRGHRYYDRLIILEREDFTRGYDSGWDGEAWGGNDAAPMSYVSTEGRWDAVSAIPEFEGTVVGFRAGEDNEYLIDFDYSPESEPLYLLDTENNTYTQVITGNAYHFTTGDKAYHERFVLTRKSPQITTGIDNVQSDNVQGTKARKILIEDKMYILINGMLYDTTGKVVK